MRMALIVLEDCEENNFIETIKSPKDDDTTNTRPLYLFLLDPCQLLLNQRGLALLEKGNLMQIFYHQGTMIVKTNHEEKSGVPIPAKQMSWGDV
ncbi:uncharacterized protein [Pocillopora verrucosa]|uniref:uncharacterized protein isoform X3 n=1 Tax=Pocillopora verrucosa TaxID=203993 RepID=UPI003341438A